MATITIRIPDQSKDKAQKLAKKMWITLSWLANIWINDFIRTKQVYVNLDDDTRIEYYQTKDAIPVNESAETVYNYLAKLVKKDEQAARKISSKSSSSPKRNSTRKN